MLMRSIKCLKFNLRQMLFALGIFYLFYTLGSLGGNGIATYAVIKVNGVDMASSAAESLPNSLQITITSFLIYMAIYSLLISQKPFKFLVTRSVTRTEAYTANMILLLMSAAICSVMQVINVYLYNLINMLFGFSFRGLSLDLTVNMAPNAASLLVFILINFSIILFTGVFMHLFGILMMRWKIQTAATAIVLILIFLAMFAVPGFLDKFIEAVKFMFTDQKNGYIIALKNVAAALIFAAITYPIARRVHI